MKNCLVSAGFLLLSTHFHVTRAGCAMVNYCNGHGTCDAQTSTCECYEGWGASSDVTLYRAPDCSARTCPSGRAWGDIPSSATSAHATAECSNKGLCDRKNGECVCFPGFEGDACQRTKCPNNCSGHGRCLSMKQMATQTDALPLSNAASYYGDSDSTTWDEDMIYGCVCDSSWTVGLESGETQTPEWFGFDCSQQHCPSGDDPDTDDDETDCEDVDADGDRGVGEDGNLCHVDCANRGLCNYKLGICACFDGYYSKNCVSKSALAIYK